MSNTDETVTIAVLGERLASLRKDVLELKNDMKYITRDLRGLSWKVAVISGILGAAAGLAGGIFGG